MLLVSGLDTSVSQLYMGRLQPLPPSWRSVFFNFIRVPNFGASLPESLDQSRDHTLLPKRPRMPVKGFIGGDWITGRKGGGWTESKKRLPWKHQRLRLEEGGELKEVRAVGSAWKGWRLFSDLHSEILMGLLQTLLVLLGIIFCSVSTAVKTPGASCLGKLRTVHYFCAYQTLACCR